LHNKLTNHRANDRNGNKMRIMVIAIVMAVIKRGGLSSNLTSIEIYV